MYTIYTYIGPIGKPLHVCSINYAPALRDIMLHIPWLVDVLCLWIMRYVSCLTCHALCILLYVSNLMHHDSSFKHLVSCLIALNIMYHINNAIILFHTNRHRPNLISKQNHGFISHRFMPLALCWLSNYLYQTRIILYQWFFLNRQRNVVFEKRAPICVVLVFLVNSALAGKLKIHNRPEFVTALHPHLKPDEQTL